MTKRNYNYIQGEKASCINSEKLSKKKNYNYGPVDKAECPNCKETDYFQLIKTELVKYRFGFFLKQSDSTKYMLVCPKCKEKILLTSSEFEKFKSLAILNKQYLNGFISKQFYLNNHRKITNDISI